MEFLTLLAALWAQIQPYATALAPLFKLFAPVADMLAPVIDIASGPVSFAFVWGVLPIYALWGFYLAVMTLKRARDLGTLTGIGYLFAVPLLVIGYVLDVAINWTLACLLFADTWRGRTFTDRLKFYASKPGTWRFTWTVWIAHHFLDKFDPAGWHVAEIYLIASDASPIDPDDRVLAALQSVMKKVSG